MSEIDDILSSRVNIKRLTDILLISQEIAASLTVDRQPGEQCRLAVKVVGATILNGTVSIAGTTDEVFSFDTDGSKVGEKNYTNISGIVVSGISDGFIEIKATSRVGQPINQEIDIHSDLSVRFYAQDGKIRMLAQGEQRVSKYKMMVAKTTPVKERDLVYAVSGVYGLTIGVISFVEDILDFDGLTHHTECEIEEL